MLGALLLVPLGLGPQGPLTYVESSTGLQTPAMDGGTTELEIADVNGDGHPDIVSVGDHGSPFVNTQEHGVMVWFGNGAGVWSVFQLGNFGYGGVALGDVDNDGRVDVGYGIHHDYSSTDFGDQIFEVALGDGTGRAWTPWDDGLATSGETYGMSGTDFADVDNDGDLDVGSNSFGCCAGIHVYRNLRTGAWTQSFGFLGGNSTSAFVFADLDNDGNADLVAGNSLGRVWFGDGQGGFVRRDAGLPGYSVFDEFGIGDVDGDGRQELAVAAGGGVALWRWNAAETNWLPVVATGLPASGSFGAVALADMDADGRVDVCAFGNGQGVVFRGDGAGGFTRAGELAGQRGGIELFRAHADVDHNGRPDVLVVVDEGSSFTSRNRPRLYAEASPADVPRLRLVRPGPNRVLRAGAVQFVEWYSNLSRGLTTPAQVSVRFSASGPEGPWAPVATVPDSGRHQWIVPREPSADCRILLSIRVGDRLVNAISERFEIR